MERKCWDCGNVAEHADNVVPHVLCTKCGSQDTRPTKKPKQGATVTLRELAELVRRERESRDYVRASFWMTTEAHAEALADHLAAEAALTQAVEQILASEVQQ